MRCTGRPRLHSCVCPSAPAAATILLGSQLLHFTAKGEGKRPQKLGTRSVREAEKIVLEIGIKDARLLDVRASKKGLGHA